MGKIEDPLKDSIHGKPVMKIIETAVSSSPTQEYKK